MKSIATITFLFALTVFSCKRTNEMKRNNTDIVLYDSIMSGETPMYPDSTSTILPVDSISHKADSIKRSR